MSGGLLEIRTDGDAILVGRTSWYESGGAVRFPADGFDREQ